MTGDPLSTFVAAIQAGRVGALKGLGGYHLVCDARSAGAVSELRRRKHRDEKPFAIMVKDLAAIGALCDVNPEERELLHSMRRPIVLLKRKSEAVVAEAVAPGNPHLGVMLPYTPLHHLLFEEYGDGPLVMTSGNRSDEPIAYEDEDAVRRLRGTTDLFLKHDRPIHVRCDDSVARIVTGRELPLRRSRGYAPEPIRLPLPCPRPILAVGGQLKGAFALGRGRQAFLSHHLGDLDHYEAYRAFEKDVTLYKDLFDIVPELIVHDLHPDYATTHYALRRGVPTFAVQHHHAHLASCMTDNGLNEPVIGVTFDGTGYGPDNTIWGGEFLVGDYRTYRRAASFRCVGLPGGDRAVREPWRIALSYLRDAGESDVFLDRILEASRRTVRTMLDRGINSPLTSSAGRLFDVVAVLAGVRDTVNYEGQAAIELERLATGIAEEGHYPFAIEQPTVPEGPQVVDTRPLILAVVTDVKNGVDAAVIGRRFHTTLVEIIVAVCRRLHEETGIDAVLLSGGVFLNILLTAETEERLTQDGFRAYRHSLVPPGDGGLCLGQLAIAAAVLGQ
jgi:hydrogenase maturation protein HypF